MSLATRGPDFCDFADWGQGCWWFWDLGPILFFMILAIWAEGFGDVGDLGSGVW